jgi:ribosomal protein S5
MGAAIPNPMEKSMVSVLVVENTGGGHRCRVVLLLVVANAGGGVAVADGKIDLHQAVFR